MKAAIIEQHGGLDVLKIQEMPEPKPAEDELVIKIHYAALNHLDIWVRKERLGPGVEMPHILGSDAAGVVIEKGSKIQGINIGDEVIINPSLFCRCCEYCISGSQSECESFGLIGLNRPGTFAEKISVPFYTIWQKPLHLDFAEASALSLVYVTAWRMLFTRGKLRPGQTVLIHGIGGGVALASLQLAKLAGAEVIVTSSSDEKLEKARGIGADHIINYKQADVVIVVKDITKGRGVDIVIDSVGADTWEKSLNSVRKGGKIILCGVTTGAQGQTNLQRLYWNQINVLGSTMGSWNDFRMMLKMVITSRLKPVIDSVHPLDQIQKAMARMEKNEQFGKILLKISN